jgi:hypothetical protein
LARFLSIFLDFSGIFTGFQKKRCNAFGFPLFPHREKGELSTWSGSESGRKSIVGQGKMRFPQYPPVLILLLLNHSFILSFYKAWGGVGEKQENEISHNFSYSLAQLRALGEGYVHSFSCEKERTKKEH